MNSRLTMAAHVLGMIAFVEREQGRATTSDELAASVGTNPVVIRRVLAQLKRAGLIDSRRGTGGGSVLARDPREINLRQAYEAIEGQDEPALLGRLTGPVGEDCDVAPVLASYLDERLAEAEEALRRHLTTITVDEISRAVVDRMKRRQRLRPGR